MFQKNFIDQFQQLKILVLGDLILDVYDFCDSANSKPSPEWEGKKVYRASTSLKTLGGSGNVAANLSTLGVSSILFGISGKDGHYFELKDLAKEKNIHHFIIRDDSRPTTIKTRLYIDNEYILRRDDEETHPIDREMAATLLQEYKREIKGADAVILSEYRKGFFFEEFAQEVIQEALQQQIPVIVDLKPQSLDWFRGATVIAPNDIEAESLVAGFLGEGEVEEPIRKLYEKSDCSYLVVTRGGNGICGVHESQYHSVPVFPVKAIDTVGCGDTVRSGLALGFALGLSFHETLTLANALGALVAQKIGTATVSPEELAGFLGEQGLLT